MDSLNRAISVIVPIAIIFCALLFIPLDSVLAQGGSGGFVPCNGIDCNFCHFIELGNNILNWLFTIVFVIFGVIMVVAGFELVTSGGNRSRLDDAKKKLSNALIGVLIMFAAWLLIDTVLKAVLDGNRDGTADGEIAGLTVGQSFGPWNQISCAGGQTQQPQGTATGTSGGVVATGCSTCVDIPNSLPIGGNTCNQSQSPTGNCQLPPALASALTSMHTAAGVSGARVTEAWPPTRSHRDPCHSNGTCVDYSRSGGMSASQVQAVINAARANGLRPVYEVVTQAQKDALVMGGVNGSDVIVVGNWISAPHFSIYSN